MSAGPQRKSPNPRPPKENPVIEQQPWLQGYLPLRQICLSKVYGFSGLDIDTGAGFVTADNIAMIKPLAEKEIR